MIDFEKFFKDYGVDSHWRRSWIQFNCPFCNDRSFHGAVHSVFGNATCFRCGRINTFDTLVWLSGLSRKELYKILPFYGNGKKQQKKGIAKYKNINVKFPAGTLDSPLKQHLNYLKKRKFDVDFLMEQFGIKFTGGASDVPNRIVVPIFWEKELVSWQARACFQTKLKYINPPVEKQKVHMKSILYNHNEKEKVYVCEGVFDVFRLMSFGMNAVATFGMTVTTEQLLLLSSHKKVIMAFDNEIKAQKKAKQIGEHLSLMGIDVKMLKYDGKDVAEIKGVSS